MLLDLVGCSSHKYRERPSTRWLRTAASYREPVDQPPAKPANEETSLIGPAALQRPNSKDALPSAQQRCPTVARATAAETAAHKRQHLPSSRDSSSREPYPAARDSSSRDEPMDPAAEAQQTGDTSSRRQQQHTRDNNNQGKQQ